MRCCDQDETLNHFHHSTDLVPRSVAPLWSWPSAVGCHGLAPAGRCSWVVWHSVECKGVLQAAMIRPDRPSAMCNDIRVRRSARLLKIRGR
jgi:hypothetical protein